MQDPNFNFEFLHRKSKKKERDLYLEYLLENLEINSSLFLRLVKKSL
jgi:hypothetical protein